MKQLNAPRLIAVEATRTMDEIRTSKNSAIRAIMNLVEIPLSFCFGTSSNLPDMEIQVSKEGCRFNWMADVRVMGQLRETFPIEILETEEMACIRVATYLENQKAEAEKKVSECLKKAKMVEQPNQKPTVSIADMSGITLRKGDAALVSTTDGPPPTIEPILPSGGNVTLGLPTFLVSRSQPLIGQTLSSMFGPLSEGQITYMDGNVSLSNPQAPSDPKSAGVTSDTDKLSKTVERLKEIIESSSKRSLNLSGEKKPKKDKKPKEKKFKKKFKLTKTKELVLLLGPSEHGHTSDSEGGSFLTFTNRCKDTRTFEVVGFKEVKSSAEKVKYRFSLMPDEKMGINIDNNVEYFITAKKPGLKLKVSVIPLK